MEKGTTALVLSTAGYLGYTVVVNLLKVDAQAMVLPQALGMVAGASMFALGKDAFKKESFKNIITGLVWGTGNLCMFQATAMIGLAVSFSLSQTGIVISTFGSILLFRRTQNEKRNGLCYSWFIDGHHRWCNVRSFKIMIYKPWRMSGMAFYI